MRRPSSQLAVFYLWTQAIVVALWWLCLWVAPGLRPWFVIGDWPVSTLFAFALPDLIVIVLGSGAAAYALMRQRPWARQLLWAVTGAVVYATLWCLGANLSTGAGALSTALMLASTAGTSWSLVATAP